MCFVEFKSAMFTPEMEMYFVCSLCLIIIMIICVNYRALKGRHKEIKSSKGICEE